MTDLSAPVATAAMMQRALAVQAAADRTLAVVEYDAHGRVLDAHPIFLELMGYTLEQLRGSDHRQLCRAEFIESGPA